MHPSPPLPTARVGDSPSQTHACSVVFAQQLELPTTSRLGLACLLFPVELLVLSLFGSVCPLTLKYMDNIGILATEVATHQYSALIRFSKVAFSKKPHGFLVNACPRWVALTKITRLRVPASSTVSVDHCSEI